MENGSFYNCFASTAPFASEAVEYPGETGLMEQQQPQPQQMEHLQRPDLSYVAIISMAIKSSPEGRLTLSEIYAFMRSRWAYFRDCGSQRRWQNSVRHNLSLNDCFQKAGKAPAGNKGHYWRLHPEAGDMFGTGSPRRRTRRFRVQKTELPAPQQQPPPSWQSPHQTASSSEPPASLGASPDTPPQFEAAGPGRGCPAVYGAGLYGNHNALTPSQVAPYCHSQPPAQHLAMQQGPAAAVYPWTTMAAAAAAAATAAAPWWLLPHHAGYYQPHPQPHTQHQQYRQFPPHHDLQSESIAAFPATPAGDGSAVDVGNSCGF